MRDIVLGLLVGYGLGGVGVLLMDFVLRLVGDLCDFVWFCICKLNDVLYDFTGWFWGVFGYFLNI